MFVTGCKHFARRECRGFQPVDIRWASTRAVRFQKVYEGPMSKSLQILKKVSVLTLGTTIATSPVMLIAPSDPWFIFGTMAAAIGAGALSTGLLQWCVNPYVSAIYLPVENVDKVKNSMMIIETFSFFGNPIRTRLSSSDILVASPKRAFTTWKIDTNHPNLCMQKGPLLVEPVHHDLLGNRVRVRSPDMITAQTVSPNTLIQESISRIKPNAWSLPAYFHKLATFLLRPRIYFFVHPSVMTPKGTELNNENVTLPSTNIPVRNALQKDLLRIHSRITSSHTQEKVGLKSLLTWDDDIDDLREETTKSTLVR